MWRKQWVTQLSVSVAALKCGVRDRWIGWDFRVQYDRLKLIANNSRFLILPEGRWPNVGSKVLSLLERRIGADWQREFGYPLLLLETFVDPRRAQGRRHRLPVVSATAAGAMLCGMRGFKAIADWADSPRVGTSPPMRC